MCWRHRPPSSTTWSGWRTATGASEARAWLGLGSNLGDREANLRAALSALARLGRIEAISRVYRTEPLGYRDQPDFWNLVLRLRTTRAPRELLRDCLAIEQKLGRTRPFAYAPRTMDIDLLLYEAVTLDPEGAAAPGVAAAADPGPAAGDEPALELPHPRLRERAFALAPLAELDPELRHPVTGETMRELAARPGLGAVEPLFPGAHLLPGGDDSSNSDIP
jgi:2-amino-4-hydroxy-6-hydroxymethyldihydropteridine diphosphokinase